MHAAMRGGSRELAQADRDIANKAFASSEWKSAAESLFHATGITVSVVDFGAGELVVGDRLCSYCIQPADDLADPTQCFDRMPASDAGVGRIVCRAGLPALYAPLMIGERTVAHVVVSGFVSSTRERRGRYESLVSKGITPDAARKVLRGVPVVSRREADSYLQVALSSARTILKAAVERERSASGASAGDVRSFVNLGKTLMATERMGDNAVEMLVEHAAAIVDGEAAALMRPKGRSLEIVAHSSGWRGALGALVALDGTVAGRAFTSRRAVMTPDGAVSPSLALPLTSRDRVLGVIEIRLSSESPEASKVQQLNQFGRSIALTLEREDERRVVNKALDGFRQLSALTTSLAAQTDVEGVSRIVGRALEVLPSSVSGLVFTGWGHDRVDLQAADEVSITDRDTVLGIVAGRDVEIEPFAIRRERGMAGTHDLGGEWAISAVDLSYGQLDIGWLFVARKDGGHYDAQDRALLEGVAAHAGAALGRAALFSRVRDDYASTVAALSAALDMGGERGGSTHSGRIMEYAVAIGRELGLGVAQLEQLRFAGLLHDRGAIGASGDIVVHSEGLSPDVIVAAQQYANDGASLVEQIDFLTALTPVILHHHENWDGSGYPHALYGETIPLLARILSVADALDMLTAPKAGQRKVGIKSARATIGKQAGTRFDPRVVAALERVLDAQASAGRTGLLSTDPPGMQDQLPS